MKNPPKPIVNQAFELPAVERLKLAEELLSSLEPSDRKMDALWTNEAEARIDAYERGAIDATSINDVFGKYDKN